MKKIRVMIVEDSHVAREFLQYVIGQDSRLEIAATVSSAEQALELLHHAAPDVITMDIRLPGMNGLEATQRIMTQRPTPIVVVAASVESEDLSISMNALRAGALAVVEKPIGLSAAGFAALANRLCSQLVLMSQVKVVRQRAGRGVDFASAASQPSHAGSRQIFRGKRSFRIVGIVTSTGGPAAIQKLIGGLEPSFPLPIVLVQHIAPAFLDGFASWLASVSPLPVQIARQGERPRPGTIAVAPGERHLRLERGAFQLDVGRPVSFQCPSGSVLLGSLARDFGAQAIGIVLTGMGDDGAVGLKEIRDAGGYTLAEDESTSIVYGMPAAAMRLDAVCESLPLPKIGPRLRELVAREQEKH
jgi:two-component system chemotaxis response regulator CheB